MAPGKEYKELAYNTIAQYAQNDEFKQKKVFTTSPVFDGKRIYLFCSDTLYCIEEK